MLTALVWAMTVAAAAQAAGTGSTAAGQPPIAPVPSLASASRILLAPFETPPHDSRAYWLGEAVPLLMTDDIDARGLGAISRAAREHAYEQLHLPPHAVLSRATVIRVGQLAGASQVIVGDVSIDGDTLVIHARPIRIDIGRAGAEVTERGPINDVFALARRVARRAVPGGDAIAPLAPPLEAFEQYVKGLLAEQAATQASFLENAIKLDPSYDRARLALWDVRATQGDHAAALAAVRSVPATSTMDRRARFRSAVSLIALRQYDDAFGVLKALETERDDPAVLNNLGVVQIRRGSPPDSGKAVYYLTKAAKAEPDDPNLLFNLGYAYALDRDPQAAIYWLREALRRNPADGDAHIVLAAALEQAGRATEASRERELAVQLNSKYADASRRETLPRGLERVGEDLESRPDVAIDQAITSTTQRDQRDVAQFHLDRGRRLFEHEQDREAMVELRRAVFLSPYEAEAHLLIGRIHLRASRPKEAVDALKISIWSHDSAPAHAALAEAYLQLKNGTAARAEVQRALELDPALPEARQLQNRLTR